MKKTNSSHEQVSGTIPDIEIIDLDLINSNPHTKMDTAKAKTANAEEQDIPEEPVPAEDIDDFDDLDALDDEETWEDEENPKKKIGWRSFLNLHMLLLAVFLIFAGSIYFKFSNWGERIDISEITSENSDQNLDILDEFLPLMDKTGNIVETGEVETIVVFGNAPFADDRDSDDNLANLIADASGATVYNCSVTGSYLASEWPFFDANEKPMDAYCFYWLVTLATSGANAHYYQEAANVLGEDIPPEAQEVYDTLTTLDFNSVDVIAVMYDAADYLMGHEMYDDANPTNIQQFTGNLEAGIELLQNTYPNIRIIVLSPTYAYAIDEETGEYVSSDMYRYGQDVLSTYVIRQYTSCTSRGVSFVDNLYGTVTEDNAQDYLIDNLHLNVEGRKLVAERFMQALNREK